MVGLLGLGPSFGCHVLDLPVGQRRQAGEDFPQVGLGVDSSTTARFDDREQDGAALPGFGFADEQPVFLADGSWPDGVLHGVVVDLDSTVFEIDEQHGPHRQGVVDGSAHGALGQVLSFEFDPAERSVDALGDHAALAGSHSLSLLRSGFGLAQLFFDTVEMLDLQKHPSSLLRCALCCFVELAPRMGPAGSQGDGFGPGTWVTS